MLLENPSRSNCFSALWNTSPVESSNLICRSPHVITACGEALFGRADHRIAAGMIGSETRPSELDILFPVTGVSVFGKCGVCAVVARWGACGPAWGLAWLTIYLCLKCKM